MYGIYRSVENEFFASQFEAKNETVFIYLFDDLSRQGRDLVHNVTHKSNAGKKS